MFRPSPDAADSVPELQGGEGLFQEHAQEQGGPEGGVAASSEGPALPVPHLQLPAGWQGHDPAPARGGAAQRSGRHDRHLARRSLFAG